MKLLFCPTVPLNSNILRLFLCSVFIIIIIILFNSPPPASVQYFIHLLNQNTGYSVLYSDKMTGEEKCAMYATHYFIPPHCRSFSSYQLSQDSKESFLQSVRGFALKGFPQETAIYTVYKFHICASDLSFSFTSPSHRQRK